MTTKGKSKSSGREERHPRLIRRGDVVVPKGSERSEVVRDVEVVLHLANGQSVPYHVSETVTLAGEDDLDEPSPEAIVEAAKADAEVREDARGSVQRISRRREP